MGRLFSGKARLVRVMLDRVGVNATIKRASNTPSENARGKIEDNEVEYSSVAEETVHPIYASQGDRPGEARVPGGRINTESPRLVFQDDTVAQEDDRVVLSDTNREYTLDERIPRATHIEFRATLVNDTEYSEK